MPRSAASESSPAARRSRYSSFSTCSSLRHRPAGQVAAPRRRRRQAGGGEEGVRRGEPARGGVHDDRDPGGRLVEALLEAQAQVLERVEGALRAVAVLGLVPSDEAQRLRLDPCHPPSRLVHARRTARHGVPGICGLLAGAAGRGAKREPPRMRGGSQVSRAPPPCSGLGESSAVTRPMRRFPAGVVGGYGPSPARLRS